ncbi:MAG TPA: UpxY family transcription antiterminator [Terriglobia bacterium]|nr:UpxY family transcription antiterminator [Terriglobia bacterium]
MKTTQNLPTPPADYTEVRWYAAYTCSHHEKRVAEQLRQKSVEHFLPVYETVRRRKDRRVRLEMPLFPGYVFVHLALCHRLPVLQIPSLVQLVRFNGTPAALPDDDIECMRRGLERGVRAEPHPYLTAGRRVQIRSGPFEGRQGILLRRKGKLRVVLSIDLIARSVVTDVDEADVEAL